MDPGSPAPQAGILDQTSREIPRLLGFNLLLDYDPRQTELIVNTLLALKNNGNAENTVKSFYKDLARLARRADLNNPEDVRIYIADATRNWRSQCTIYVQS